MRLRPFMALLFVLAIAAPAVPTLSTPSYAQTAAEMPPMPRPRPDPDSLPSSQGGARPEQTPATDAISDLTSVPQPVILTARITPDGAQIPDGLVWRIFDTVPDASGELALVAKSELGQATVELPPGEYVVHVAYGRAQTSDGLSVVPGSNEKSFVIDAGALRLNSAVTGDIPIPVDLLKFDIFTSGNEGDRTPVAEGLAANDIVTLNAGTYHIVSHFGSINAVVRADLRVEAGQLTDATLYHHASQVSFKLVSEAGGEAIADVEWTVKTPDGATVFTELGAFPTTVLAEGDYSVLAKQGSQVFNREFQVQPGAAREIEVLTAVY
ncbi:hypothetical protein [Devosia psychrophila]|uniref:Carboxypeptidase regulatory-like domain-containing protein n=1 Tax=Devosia psychrophila TaxID=728005 RepID=A0A1I1QXJ1_9HYPH|nr:hypothetical protein [Devosia psychrophila]SFD24598.1 hypothetical protein SAMN04488059_13222 [Devosia psychrophila]